MSITKMHYKDKKNVLGYILTFVVLLAVLVICMPFYYIVVNTFKTMQDATFHPISLPGRITLDNYINALKIMNFFRSFSNNIIITFFTVLFSVFICSAAAYPIARRKTKLNSFLKFYFVSGLMVPLQAIIIPLYLVMKSMHFVNSFHGIILLYIGTGCAFNVFLYQGFVKTIPYDIEESALIDGCSPIRIYWSIVLPLMQPITATVIVYQAMITWNDFLSALLFLQSSKLQTMVLAVNSNIGSFATDWSNLICMMVLTILPVFIFFIFMQKYIIKGLTSGAVKG
ncbi:MAG TPA: carbohydrate ABC transporter permease [Ruminiclostridium sp.]